MKPVSILMLSGMSNILGRALCMARCISHSPDTVVHVLSKNNWDPTRFSRHVRSYHVTSGTADNQWIESIEKIVRRRRIDVIFPVTSSEIRFVSSNRESLQSIVPIVPVPEAQLLDTVSDKAKLADFLIKKKISGPETITSISDTGAFMRKLAGITFPVLLKHATTGGGHNIQYFDKSEELLDFIHANLELAKQSVVQTFIPGHDIHCHVLCSNGKIQAYAASEKMIASSRQFGRPNCIKFIKNAQVSEYLTNLIDIIKWNGMAHLDLRFDKRDRQLKLIDFNPDWDDSVLGAVTAGINFPYLACLAGLGIDFPDPDISHAHFIRGKIAIQQGIKKIFRKDEIGLTFSETSWKYALQDPVSEIVRLIQRFYRKTL